MNHDSQHDGARPAAVISEGARRGRWRRYALFSGSVIVLVIAVLVLLLLATPGGYAPPHIAMQQRQAVRDNLLAAEQAFTESLRTRAEPFIYHIHEGDLNRWLAMREEFYPWIDESVSAVMTDPVVRFLEDGIVLACRLKIGAARPLIRLTVEPILDGDAIVLRATRLHCGSIRVPLAWLGDALSRGLDRRAEETWPGSPSIGGNLQDGVRIDRHAWWKNGGIAYRVNGVALHGGVLDLTIEPRGRHR